MLNDGAAPDDRETCRSSTSHKLPVRRAQDTNPPEGRERSDEQQSVGHDGGDAHGRAPREYATGCGAAEEKRPHEPSPTHAGEVVGSIHAENSSKRDEERRLTPSDRITTTTRVDSPHRSKRSM